jgi:glutaredoxin
MIKKILTTAVVIASIILQYSISSAQQVDYMQAVKNYLSTAMPKEILMNIDFDVREVLDTKSPDWKAVIVYIREGRVNQPVPIFVSKDGKTIVPVSMVFVNNKPIFTKQLHPEFEKIDFKFSDKNRIVYNHKGQKTVFYFHNPDCPYCKQVKEKLKTYKGNYRIVLKHFPSPMNRNAKEESIAMQIDWMRSKETVLNEKALRKEAQRIVEEDVSEAMKAEIMGTPFFVDTEGNILDIVPILREIGIPGV